MVLIPQLFRVELSTFLTEPFRGESSCVSVMVNLVLWLCNSSALPSSLHVTSLITWYIMNCTEINGHSLSLLSLYFSPISLYSTLYSLSPFSCCFQRRTVKKSQSEKPKPKKDSDILRERIIRRAALEFEDGMYGILLGPVGNCPMVPPLLNHRTRMDRKCMS